MTASTQPARPAGADFLRQVASREVSVAESLDAERRLRALAAALDELRAGFDDLTETGDARRMLESLSSLFDQD